MSVRRLALVAIASFCLAAGGLGHTQELESFELEEVFDFRLLRVTKENPRKTELAYFNTHAYLGYINDYQRRATFTDANLRFLRASTGAFWNKNQMNIDLTGFDDVDDDEFAEFRGKLAYSRYFISGGMPRRVRARILVDKLGDEGTTTEIGFDLQASFNMLRTRRPTGFGGISYTFDANASDHYLSVNYRTPLVAYGGGIKLVTGGGVGAESVGGHTQFAAVKLEGSLEIPIPGTKSKVHVVATPMRELASPDWDVEYSIFLNSFVWDRIRKRN